MRARRHTRVAVFVLAAILLSVCKSSEVFLAQGRKRTPWQAAKLLPALHKGCPSNEELHQHELPLLSHPYGGSQACRLVDAEGVVNEAEEVPLPPRVTSTSAPSLPHPPTRDLASQELEPGTTYYILRLQKPMGAIPPGSSDDEAATRHGEAQRVAAQPPLSEQRSGGPRYTPSASNMRKRQWFGQRRLGLFVHFGLYALLGGGEWVLEINNFTLSQYATLPARFNPSKFNATEWVLLAKATGPQPDILDSNPP